MAATIGAPRVLLRRLREIMAENESKQDRLNKIVIQVAAIMVTEVSSIYLRHLNGTLELFATKGLNRASVHKLILQKGEGLVGLVAERSQTINLENAQSHPAFSYQPNIGEDSYHSFLGVPILRGGRTVGVLTIQNRVHRHYSEEEVEALQTTAMVLAELIATGDIEGIGTNALSREINTPLQIRGQSLCEGIALGHVVLHEPRIIIHQLIAENIEHEQGRIKAAISSLRQTIDERLRQSDVARAGEHREVLEAFRMFAHDRGWLNRLEETISSGLTADAAVEKVQTDMRLKIDQQANPFLREHIHDLEDLSNRLLRILAGHPRTADLDDLPEDAILVARTMGAAELLDYDRAHLRGLVLEEGTPTSHVAIVARALGIAAIGQAKAVLDSVESDDAIIVDAEGGLAHLRPSQDVIAAYSDKVRLRARRQSQYAKLKDRPAVTKDGQYIGLNMNAGLLADLPHLAQSGADGIGLFRTELQFMIVSSFPRRKQQTEIYKNIIAAANGKPVVFRSLDIGGDKILPYMEQAKEENPALGWRAIRICLDRPGLFRTQIRALLRASPGIELKIMLPMIAEVHEYEKAKALIEREQALLLKHHHEAPKNIVLGAMIEVPSILWQLDQLFSVVDFASIGSNDLMQFLFAADRGNTRIADRFDTLSPAMLRALRHIVEKGAKYRVPLTLCGEMAGRPLEAMALIGLGFRSLSLAAPSIGPLKAMILSLDAAKLEEKLLPLIASNNDSIRPHLESFCAEHGVQV